MDATTQRPATMTEATAAAPAADAVADVHAEAPFVRLVATDDGDGVGGGRGGCRFGHGRWSMCRGVDTS